MKTIKLLLLGAMFITSLNAQKFEETNQLKHTFSNNQNVTVVLLNISGNINIEEQDGDNLVAEVTKTIEASNSKDVELGKKEMKIIKEMRGDTLLMYLSGPCLTLIRRDNKNEYNYDWHGNCDEQRDYDYRFDFNMTVPTGANLYVSTVNNGDIHIKESKGVLHALNVNGNIRLDHMSGPSTYASTINGDVDIYYDKNPERTSRYYTLNGDINAYFLPGVNAIVKFKSFNGEFFTDMDKVEAILTSELVKIKRQKGIAYEVDNNNRIKIGNGSDDLILDFETFNGNAYLRTKK